MLVSLVAAVLLALASVAYLVGEATPVFVVLLVLAAFALAWSVVLITEEILLSRSA